MTFDHEILPGLSREALDRRMWEECIRRGDLWKREQALDDDFAWMLYQHRKVDTSACHSCGQMYSSRGYHEHLASLVIGYLTYYRKFTITHE